MPPPIRPSELVRQLVESAYELTRHKLPPYWVSGDEIVSRLGLKHSEITNEAFAYAVSNNLLASSGELPPMSVAVTSAGAKMAEGNAKFAGT